MSFLEFNPNIQYNELQKGRQLGEGAFAAVFEWYVGNIVIKLIIIFIFIKLII